MSLGRLRRTIVVVSLMLLSGFVGFNLGQGKSLRAIINRETVVDRSQPIDKQTVNLDLFWEVWDLLSQRYLIDEKLDSQEMVWGAIRGMSQALDDPYTVFLSPKENETAKDDLNGSFEGVGIQLGYKEKNLAVIAPLEGMPAEAAGIRAGDYILNIKDEAKSVDTDTIEMSLPEAVKLIRGPKGTSVILTILHEGDSETIDIEITRDMIIIESVKVEFEDQKQANQSKIDSFCLEGRCVAYLRLSRFGDRTEEEWNQSVDKIIKKMDQIEGLILDLRNNPGGYLQGAISYASEFLANGLVVVQQVDGKGNVETFSVRENGRLLEIPLLILINKGSASSSEIVAGALRDHGRAKLVGTKTFGKGTIQEAQDLQGGAGVHITVAKWITPNGIWVNETKGLEPDFQIEDDLETKELDEQLKKAVELLLDNS